MREDDVEGEAKEEKKYIKKKKVFELKFFEIFFR